MDQIVVPVLKKPKPLRIPKGRPTYNAYMKAYMKKWRAEKRAGLNAKKTGEI